MITFALTPHRITIIEAKKICAEQNCNKIRLFVDLRNSIPAFFDENKVKILLKDIETSILSFVESTIKFMEYCMLNFNKPVEFHFFYEVGRSEYHRKLNKDYKSNRHNSYLILSPDEVKQASDLNIKCFDAIYAMLQNARNTKIYKLQYFEADFIPHYISREFPDPNSLDIILSNDKDMFQSLTKDHKMILFKKDFRKKETRIINFDNMYQEISKADITIASDHNFIADILAVVGDESDGVPGVKGLGYITVIKLYKELNIPLEEILKFDSVDSLLEKYSNVEIKGRLLTALKKIFENKELIENNRKQVDYNIIMENMSLATRKNISESYNNEGDFDKFYEDIKFLKTNFTSLLSMMFPEQIRVLEIDYLPYIENDIYQPVSVDRHLREQVQQQALRNPNEQIQINADILNYL